MKITPLEIRQHEFEKTFRGYNIEEVDNFLVNLSQEWERVLNETKMLRMQLEIAEKEANKLREIEMTLFKTLKTAEDTSTMITEQASQQADKHIQEVKLQGEKLLIDAQQKANGIVRQADERARYIKEEVLGDVKVLERDFRAMDHYKTNLLEQMRTLSTATLEHVQRFEDKFDKEGVDAKFKEATSMLTDEEQTEANIAAVVAPIEKTETEEIAEMTEPVAVVEEEIVADIPSITPETVVEKPVIAEIQPVEEIVEAFATKLPVIEEKSIIEVEKEVVRKNDTPKDDELEIIEGIGPKIAMLLYDSGIFTFRDLATTPVYKIQEILEQAGPQFARHDPSTWTQQAKLAAEGRWNDLEALKFYLVGGREPKKDEEIAEPVAEVQVPALVVEEVTIVPEPIVVEESVVIAPVFEAVKEVEVVEKNEEVEDRFTSFTQAPIIPVENNLDSITEEMLEKVNKVKAAIRKAMVEKNNEAPLKDHTPLPTLNDVIAKNESSSSSSFFDNL